MTILKHSVYGGLGSPVVFMIRISTSSSKLYIQVNIYLFLAYRLYMVALYMGGGWFENE
jgi:hypothetical protein